LTFRGAANGEEAPIRVIQGPHTKIQGDYPGTGANDRVSIDPVNGEYYMFSTPNQILVFDRAANGDVPPKRILGGPNTLIQGRSASGVDPIRNLLVVNSRGKMMIFDRTANGNVKPKAIIAGPNSGMGSIGSFQVYPPKGLIIAGGQGGFIGAWSVEDTGDVPPRFKLPAKQITDYDPLGIALDPVHKEVIFSAAANERSRPNSGIMSAIITFSWPEIF
jgi:hypothetical protein